jgi:DNA ligase-4
LGEQEAKGVKLNTVEKKPDSPFQRTTAAEAMSSAPGEKIEQMVDPLHAMLLDMLPLLGKKGTEDTSRAPLAKVEKDPPAVGSSISNSEILVPDAGTSGVPAPDPNAAPPAKKKKVSYKDVASELLKDC